MARHGTADTARHDGEGSTAPDALASLLQTERQLSDDIASAEEKARALAESAKAAVARMEVASGAELAESIRALEKEEEAATLAAIAAGEHAARDEVQRLTAVPDEVIGRLANAVLRDFLGIATIGAHPPGARAGGGAMPVAERAT